MPYLATFLCSPLPAAEHELVLPGMSASHALKSGLSLFEVSPERAEHTSGALAARALERHFWIYCKIERVFIIICVDDVSVNGTDFDVVALDVM